MSDLCICEQMSNFFFFFICENWPPQCSSHTVNRLVLFVNSGSRLLHSMTIAWGIMMTHDTTQMTTILLRALLPVLLNISGWQMAYQRSWAMQLSVRTDTETEIVLKKKNRNTSKIETKYSGNGIFSTSNFRNQIIDPVASYGIHHLILTIFGKMVQ